jgi:hypothetical protein
LPSRGLSAKEYGDALSPAVNSRFAVRTALKLILVWALLAALAPASRARLFNYRKSAATNTAVAATAAVGLSEEEMVAGLKEALVKGVDHAVAALGHNGGFLTNSNVKILLPDKLQPAENTLRLTGQTRFVDDFVSSMNRAAERAVPAAASKFKDAIRQMSIEDAWDTLNGPDDAATQLFRRTTQTNLYTRFYPIVLDGIAQAGAMAKYKAMMGKFMAVYTPGAVSGSKNVGQLEAADLDAYVTDRALEGLFQMVAEEEKKIRTEPLARTSDLLQKVFGAVAK